MEEVTLQEVLLSREERVERQKKMQEKFSSTLLSFTMNIAGPVKTSPLILRAFREGKEKLLSLFSPEEILSFSLWEEKTGPLLLLATAAEAEIAKERCLEINPDLEINVYNTFFMPDTSDKFDFSKYDYVVYAIDTVT